MRRTAVAHTEHDGPKRADGREAGDERERDAVPGDEAGDLAPSPADQWFGDDFEVGPIPPPPPYARPSTSGGMPASPYSVPLPPSGHTPFPGQPAMPPREERSPGRSDDSGPRWRTPSRAGEPGRPPQQGTREAEPPASPTGPRPPVVPPPPSVPPAVSERTATPPSVPPAVPERTATPPPVAGEPRTPVPEPEDDLPEPEPLPPVDADLSSPATDTPAPAAPPAPQPDTPMPRPWEGDTPGPHAPPHGEPFPPSRRGPAPEAPSASPRPQGAPSGPREPFTPPSPPHRTAPTPPDAEGASPPTGVGDGASAPAWQRSTPDPGARSALPAQPEGAQVPPVATGPQPVPDGGLGPLVRERRSPPAGGWRKAVHAVTFGLVHPGESAAELRRRELVARARTHVAGGHHRLAVLSLKGGVGKTTTTVALGSTLASLRGDRVLAVDANPDRGTLSDKVHLETAATIRDLLNEKEQIQRYADIRAFTSQSPSRLEILASDQDPAVSEAFSETDYREVSRLLEHFYTVCLTDCGTGLLHSAMRGVLGLADQIIVVTTPSVDGARSASATLDWLEAHEYGYLVRGAVVVLAMVRPHGRSTVDLDRLEGHFANRVRTVVRVPWDAHLEEGAEVVLERMHPATREAFLELAATVGEAFAWPR
uniref:MinD/ParA family ATP-binding protein n=1 Tax=Marinactinospora thermotolerans TaxID=531310 RepID=UPI00099A106B